MRFHFSSFSFDIPDDWGDITPDDDPMHPFTIALDEGVGVIQFSLAEWKSGEFPTIADGQLRSMFEKYCEAQQLVTEASAFRKGRILGVGGRGSLEGDLVGAWYISDGANVALVTYLGGQPGTALTEAEFKVAERMVESADFSGQAITPAE